MQKLSRYLVAAIVIGASSISSSVLAGPEGGEGEQKNEQREFAALRQFAPDAEVRSDDAGRPNFVVGRLGRIEVSQGPQAAAEFAGRFATVLGGVGNEKFAVVRERIDQLGQSHVRLQQQIHGRAVVGADVIVHTDLATGEVLAVNGRIAPEANFETEPRIPSRLALNRAKAEAGIVQGRGRNAETGQSEADLVYIVDEQTGAPRLAWSASVDYVDENGDPQRDRVFADAATGEFLTRHPQFHYAKNRRTYTANNGTSLPGTLRRSEGQANYGDAALDAAHNYAGNTYDYYSSIHSRDSYNNAGATLTSTVHYSTNYNNAFWNGSQMVYGDGDGTTFTHLSKSLDVAAHELTHAVTEYEANLVYQKEPGALNEAMSDIFGASVEAWVDGGVTSATWLLGEDIYTPNNGNNDALRYMANPTQDGYSKDYYPERLYPGSCTPNPNTNDQCGVHGNSGIANLAYVLLVQGGTHPRGKTSVSVPPIGLAKAEKIFYRALTVYLTSSSNFEAARTATAQAATDLYSATEVAAVHKAWDAVGVPGGGSTPPPGGSTLSNGVPVSNISGASGSETRWTMSVPSGASNLSFTISGGSGDADMYVKFGTAPTTSSYDCRPYKSGNSETCSFASPSAGTWHVMLRGYSAYSGVTLTGSYSTAAPNNPPTANFTFTPSGLTVSFTNTSTDSDGTIASRNWNFGDGTSSTTNNPSKTYSAGGTYNVTLTVTDDDGASASTTKSVTVTAPSGCGGTSYSGSLSSGASAYQPNGSYYYSSSSGTHTGALDGPSGTDFDLYLQKWSGSSWSNVRSGTTSAADESVSYSGTSGYYRWRVHAYSGSGSYTLCTTKP